jgi:hypothetical protein
VNDKTKAPMLLEFTCSQRWLEMAGDESARHCAQCDQQVINISDYSQAQINELQERIDCGEKICVAFKAVKPEPAEILGEWLPLAFPESSAGISGLLACSLTLCSCSLLAQSASPARAQDGQKQESPRKGPLAPSTKKDFGFQVVAPPSQRPPKAKPGQNANSDVMLAPSEYALMAGRPAPSFLRDTVTELMYGRDDFFNLLPMILRSNIRQQVEKDGSINIPQIEWMANLQDFQGRPGEALNSYRLLLALANRQQVSDELKEERKVALWKKINRLAPVAYLAYLKEVDRSADCDWALLDNLNKAQEVRTLSPAIEKHCPWNELAVRIERLAKISNSSDIGNFALAASAVEPKTTTMRAWRKKFIDEKTKQFSETLEKGKKEFAYGRTNDAFHSFMSVSLPQDSEVVALCDLDGLVAVWSKLMPHLEQADRFTSYRTCIDYVRSPTYHSRDGKSRKVLSGLLVEDLRKCLALSQEELVKGDRTKGIILLAAATSLSERLPEIIPGDLFQEIRKRRLELKLQVDEEVYF